MSASHLRPWVGVLAPAMVVALCVASSPIAVAESSPSLPAAGSDPASLDPSLVEGARPHGDGWAVPLRADRPAWLTQRLLRRVHAARGRPVAVPDRRIPVAATIETGIRPGSLMVAPYGCTMNFVFRRRGGFAIGTAGHCVDEVGQRVGLMVRSPTGDVVVLSVGRVVKRALSDRRSAPDFALVRVRERLESWVRSPITSIGGPCGVFRGSGLRTLWHYGYPLALAGAERFGYSLSWGEVSYSWAGTAASGDSGSPVRTGGYGAAGNLTHFGYSVGAETGTVFGTRMTWIEDFVAPWHLVSSPGCG